MGAQGEQARRAMMKLSLVAGLPDLRPYKLSMKLLVHPVHVHRVWAPLHATVFCLGARDVERLYRRRFAHVEFCPTNIGVILDNPLPLGTFLAVADEGYEWRRAEHFLASPPTSRVVASLWDCGEVFRLEVRGTLAGLLGPSPPHLATSFVAVVMLSEA